MTNPPPLEVELKLALPPQQAGMFIKRMMRRRSQPVQLDLVTRYFDTPDFALSAQGVALRVRRMGRRWLQTIKTEGERCGGLSQRIEYEVPVRRGSPDWSRFPAEALAHVPEALHDHLAPVFETRFRRTAWLIKGKSGAQIEVALDVGEVHAPNRTDAGGSSQPICEIELELKTGQPDALFALALDWAGRFGCLPFDISKAERGVRLAHGQTEAPVKSRPVGLNRGMSMEAGFAAMVQACLTQFQANVPGVLASGDIEYVHQARVALRRLRAVLRMFRQACAVPDELMAGLRTLAAALGPVRDWDVLCRETLPRMAPHFSSPALWQRGQERLETRRLEVRTAMQTAILQAQPGVWLLAWQRWLGQRGWQAVPEPLRLAQLSGLKKWASRALRKGHRSIARDAGRFAQLQPAQCHALRLAIKRQRYAAEFFQPLFAGRRHARYLTALQALQDSMGRNNDANVAWKLLNQAQMHDEPMGQFALGWLAARRTENTTGEIVGQLQKLMKSVPGW